MSYQVKFSKEARNFLKDLDKKSKSICKKNLEKLSSPYPGRGLEDKEKLIIGGKERYRLHLGRTFTAFYLIDEEEKLVRVVEILSIEVAHKKYGFK
jgi:mRNA-degrading endonuclease RelE of RelBE toxin-antitoxin system